MLQPHSLHKFLLPPGQGRSLWHLGALITFKAIGSETDNQFWALEGLADKHMAVPLHVHTREDEFWFVLDGEIHFTVGSETQVGTSGSFVHIPRLVPHTFQIRSETARWFGVGTPAGLDQWFFETGEPAGALTLPPPPSAPPDVEWIVSTLKSYGTDTLGPPPAQSN